jgi:hypothetical protein
MGGRDVGRRDVGRRDVGGGVGGVALRGPWQVRADRGRIGLGRAVGRGGERAGGGAGGKHQGGEEGGKWIQTEAERGARQSERQRQHGRRVVQQQRQQRKQCGQAGQAGGAEADGLVRAAWPCGTDHAQPGQGCEDCRQQRQKRTIHGGRG